jgi:ubiquitin carboxyl-terminal hydrolase 4/11/15
LIAEFFNTNAASKYKEDVNHDNPIGYDGAVAYAFAALLENLLCASNSYFAPRAFKQTIGKYGSAFAGYSQQDSQEFLAFLLDALHEDLNRIRKKPATEKPELPEEKVDDMAAIARLADECWRLHKLRNDSIILDLFAGLYRSTLVCPDCQKISITFDPFMDLTLPLPSDNSWIREIIVVPLKGRPMLFEVALDKHSTIRQLKEYIAKHLGMGWGGGADRLFSTEVYNFRFYKHHEDRDIVSDKIEAGDTAVIYELDRPINDDASFLIPVFHRTARPSTKEDSRLPPRYDSGGAFHGLPFFITLTTEEAENDAVIRSKIDHKYEEINGGDIMINEPELQLQPNGNVEEAGEQNTAMETENELPSELSMEEAEQSHQDDAVVEETSVKETPLETPIQEASASTFRLSLIELKTAKEDPMTGWNISSNLIRDFSLRTAPRPPAQVGHANSVRASPSISELRVSESIVSTPGSPQLSDQDALERSPIAPLTDVDTPELDSSSDGECPVHQLIFRGEGLVCDWERECIAWDPDRRENPHSIEVRRQLESEQNKQVHLEDCLDLFSKSEVLGQDDLWYCSRCQCLRQATKTIELWRVPDIFTVHLKRFSSFRSFRDKISDRVDFPIEGLDMSSRVGDKTTYKDGDLIYDLFAVDNHYGGLGGGHYTAFAKNFVNGKWYYFDDSSVHVTDPEKAITGAAYLLFYRRRSSKPLGGDQMQAIVEEARAKIKEAPLQPPPTPLDLSTRSTGHVLGTASSAKPPIWMDTTLTLGGTTNRVGYAFGGEDTNEMDIGDEDESEYADAEDGIDEERSDENENGL